MKRILFAAALCACAGIAPAFADEMAKCDDATMMKVEKDLMAMTDASKKEMMDMGMKELDMAKMAMKDNKADDCSMHLGMAMKHAMGQ